MSETENSSSETASLSPINQRDMITIAKMAGPIVFVCVIGIYFHEFVWHAVSANKAINSGIILVSVFDMCLIFIRLIDAQRDFRIIERFGFEAKKGVYMKTLLDQPWLKGRYIRHYLNHIANTGGTLSTDLEYSAIESELHALQRDYDSRLELPQFFVGFMIAMGLLGTFIGLLETLTGIAEMLDSMGGSNVQEEFVKLVGQLRNPLAGMGIAFSASMFGLITSLMLSIMMTNLRHSVNQVVSLARNVMHELTELGKHRKDGASQAEVDALLANSGRHMSMMSDEPKPMRPDLPSGEPGVGLDPALAGRFEVMTKKMEMLLETISESNTNTRRLNELIGYGPRMKEISEKTLEEIKNFSIRNNEQQRFMQSLVEQMSEMREIGIGSGRHLNDIKEIFTKFSKNANLVEMIAANVGGQTALLEVLVNETRRSQQNMSRLLGDAR